MRSVHGRLGRVPARHGEGNLFERPATAQGREQSSVQRKMGRYRAKIALSRAGAGALQGRERPVVLAAAI